MVNEQPSTMVTRERMGARRILAIAILTACTAAEGFDVYAISLAAPRIAQAWSIDPATLGIVLAMDLVGMGLGAVLLGRGADRFGRKPVILVCLAVMATGMWLASRAPDNFALSAVRFYTGLGVGGLLATSSAMAAELASDRLRGLAVTLLIGGFSLGAIACGAVASTLLAGNGRWQAVFEVGALASALLIVPVLLLVPESPVFRSRRRSTDARGAPPSVLEHDSARGSLRRSEIARTGLYLTLAFFTYMASLYFLMKWIPKLIADMGHSPSSSGAVLIWAHIGGLAGTVAIGLASQVAKARRLVVGALLCGAAAVALFGQQSHGLAALTVIAGAAGFFIIGGNSAFYAIVAESFPPRLRAAGIGFVIGAGRVGSAVGPIAAGFLFQAGWPLAAVSIVMAFGCLIAAIAVTMAETPAGESGKTVAATTSG